MRAKKILFYFPVPTMTSRLLSLPTDLQGYLLHCLVSGDPTSLCVLRPVYRVPPLRQAVRQYVVDFCLQQYKVRLDVATCSHAVAWLLARFDSTPLSRHAVSAFTALSNSFVSPLFAKGERSATVSFPELWCAMVRKEINFATFFQDRELRREKMSLRADVNALRAEERRNHVTTLLEENGLLSLPRHEKALIDSYLSRMPRLRDEVTSAILQHRTLVETRRSPEDYFPGDRRAAVPQVMCCSRWTGTWFFCQSYGHPVVDLSVVVYRNDTYQRLFNVPYQHHRHSNIVDMACTELGDIVLLYSGYPWLVCHSEAGPILMQLERHHYAILHRPNQLCVGKSGMNYVSDPKTMLVQRFTPEGVPIAPLRCPYEPDLFCLDPHENVCVLTCQEPRIVVFDWQGNVTAIVRVPSVRPESFFCDSQNNWYIGDHMTMATEVYRGDKRVGRLYGFGGRTLSAIDHLDRMSFFNRTYFCVESFRAQRFADETQRPRLGLGSFPR